MERREVVHQDLFYLEGRWISVGLEGLSRDKAVGVCARTTNTWTRLHIDLDIENRFFVQYSTVKRIISKRFM